MRTALVVLFTANAATALSQDHSSCPMHAGATHKAQVDHRHQGATGIPTEGTEHHFVVAPDGGSIRLAVKDPRQTQALDGVRSHLRLITRSFAAGDFALPTQIHSRVPPGAETLKARRDKLRYSYSDVPDGGVVTIRTTDREALAALHEFLRFQVSDHETGDSLE